MSAMQDHQEEHKKKGMNQPANYQNSQSEMNPPDNIKSIDNKTWRQLVLNTINEESLELNHTFDGSTPPCTDHLSFDKRRIKYWSMPYANYSNQVKANESNNYHVPFMGCTPVSQIIKYHASYMGEYTLQEYTLKDILKWFECPVREPQTELELSKIKSLIPIIKFIWLCNDPTSIMSIIKECIKHEQLMHNVDKVKFIPELAEVIQTCREREWNALKDEYTKRHDESVPPYLLKNGHLNLYRENMATKNLTLRVYPPHFHNNDTNSYLYPAHKEEEDERSHIMRHSKFGEAFRHRDENPSVGLGSVLSRDQNKFLNQIDKLSNGDIAMILMGNTTLSHVTKSESKHIITMLRDLKKFLIESEPDESKVHEFNDDLNIYQSNLSKTIDPRFLKLLEAIWLICELNKGQRDEKQKVQQYLGQTLRTSGILIPWRKRWKQFTLPQKYWQNHVHCRLEALSEYTNTNTWVIKSQYDILQPTAKLRWQEIKQRVKRILIDRINLKHNMMMWIKLGLFPPKYLWDTDVHPGDYELCYVIPKKKHVGYAPTFAFQNELNNDISQANSLHLDDNYDGNKNYLGCVHYWLKVTLKHSCLHPFENYITHWLDAHAKGIIEGHWIIEPFIPRHVRIANLTHKKEAKEYRLAKGANQDIAKQMGKIWPIIFSEFGDKLDEEYETEIDFNVVRNSIQYLGDHLNNEYGVSNYNPPDVTSWSNPEMRRHMKRLNRSRNRSNNQYWNQSDYYRDRNQQNYNANYHENYNQNYNQGYQGYHRY
eukprot:276125_1